MDRKGKCIFIMKNKNCIRKNTRFKNNNIFIFKNARTDFGGTYTNHRHQLLVIVLVDEEEQKQIQD